MGADRIIATRSQVPVGEGRNVMHARRTEFVAPLGPFDFRKEIGDKERQRLARLAKTYASSTIGLDIDQTRVSAEKAYALFSLLKLTGVTVEPTPESFTLSRRQIAEDLNPLGDVYRRFLPRLINSAAFLQMIFPGVLPPSFSDDTFAEWGRNAIFSGSSQAVLPLKILYPEKSLDAIGAVFPWGKLSANEVLQEMQEELKLMDDRRLLPGISQDQFAREAAKMRLLCPEEWNKKDILTPGDWDYMREILENSKKEEKWELFASQAFYMTILAAKKVAITPSGEIFIELPPVSKQDENTSPIPPRRRFGNGSR